MPLLNSNFLSTFTSAIRNHSALLQPCRPGKAAQKNTKKFMEPDRAPTTEKFSATFYSSVICLALTILLFSCNKKVQWVEVNPAFSQYIDAYTTGVISKASTIKIQLAADANTTHAVGEVVNESLFDFTPAVKGKAFWVNARTIEFKPDEWLQTDKLYEVNFSLGKVTKVPADFANLRFSVKTVKPSFKVTQNGLRSSGVKNKMSLTGELETADLEKADKIEALLKASNKNQSLKISWQHNDAAKSHRFTIDNIERGSAASDLVLNWDGGPMKMDVKDEAKITVPAIGDFKVLNIMAMNEAQQYASVQFSDPIDNGQDLTGLITMSNQADLSYTINGSEVKLFTSGNLDGNYTVNANTGIKNTWGDVLEKSFTSNINFENKLPNVKIQGKGNILPNSGRLVLPFEAVNLKAVDISIIKILQSNVPQFLQENNLAGNTELRRVSKPVVQKTLRLDDDKNLDLHKHQRFSLDIDKYLKTEQGAIYRVTIGFRPEYSLYQSIDTAGNKNDSDEEDESYYREDNSNGLDEDDAFWDRYDTYYPYGYNWQKADDPSSTSYYNKDRWATRNILASNIGLTAKRGNDNKLLVAVTNILTTEPMRGIDLEVLDYQQTIVGTGKSSSDGFATIDLARKPFLLVAKTGNERGYLKLDDGSSLALSRFDVSGEEIKDGIKGFIFGERGVWRPGDTMYINCIIEDKEKKLPSDHPIEFSLFTPRGQLYKQVIQKSGEDGFYVFKVNTDAASPTGNWLAKVKVGGAAFEKRLKVETIMPNRLKINVDFGKDAILGDVSNASGTINAKWLFGSPGKNLKAKIDASLSAKKTSFAKFAGYDFDNPTSGYNTQSKTIYDGTLDAEGNAVIKPDFNIDESAPGMLNANLVIKVFEPGGAFSIDNMSLPYSPYKSYVGLKLPEGEKPFNYLLTGKQHTAQIVNVDKQGNLIGGDNKVEVMFYRIQWRWWWDDDGDNLSNFTQNEYNKLLKKDSVQLTNGRGQWQFSTSANDWGRYLVLVKDLKSGHMTGSTIYIDEPGWQTREGNDDQTAASMLSFTSNKVKYGVGEDIALNIPSSKGGRLLISLESGSKVVRSFWQETTPGQTVVKFKAEPEMAPNIYATVSLLQPHSQTINDLPIRMYGSIPIFVEDKNTMLNPVINIPNAIRPEQKVSFTVSEQQGKEMTYCVAIVDEGLLDLTRFKTPDPHAAFYAREALGVKSFDMFDYVIGAWGGDLERILTIGGDGEAGPVKQKTANRFKPVVKYLGPFHLASGQKQTQSFTLPSYIGSVRAMVVAAHNGSYGMTDKTVAVKKPLMLLATMPRVLGPGETIKLPVTVFAMENNIKTVNVTLQSNPYLEIVGSPTQVVNFTETGEQMAYFDVKVNPAIGIGKIKLIATSGREKAEYLTELDIRNPNPAITIVSQITLAPGQQWKTVAEPIGVAATSSAVVEISAVPAMDLQKRLNYLIQYPHGCIEQTTSSVFPQLVLNQLTDLDDFKKAQIERNIKAGISRMQNFQRPDGGFSYWPGGNGSDEWGTNYAGHFLIEAQNNGYLVGDDMLQLWKNFQRSKANAWYPSTTNFYGADLDQAYRLYTLALAKAPELGAMNRLKEFKYLSPEAKWRLAAAYKLIGQNNTAIDLISGLPLTFENRTYAGITYGSDLRDEAMVLETLTIMGKRDKAAELLPTIAAALSQDSWYSTQTTAYALIAIAKYCGKNPSGAKIIAATNVDGKATAINSNTYIRQIPVVFSKGNSNVEIKNNGSNTLYVRLITQGQPLSGENLKVNNNPSVLVMSVDYLSQDGKALDVSKLYQGSDFIAKVVIKNPGRRGRYTEMALTQIFPSGWEILNARMLGGEGAFKSSASTYQDIRDDRVYTYFNINQNETLTYYIQLNASYLGRYFLPGTFCEAMYDNSIAAGVSGKWVEVVAPGP
ncbi:MG2 domain-containing protein [soil metagenome]